MKSFKAKVLNNEQVAPHAYKMTLSALEIAKKAQPGQFVMVRVSDTRDPLLRRPFGIHNVNGAKVDILYEIAGEGTKLLSQKAPGEFLDIVGPVGNGFDCRKPLIANRKPILIAGGMGVAPLVFLAEKLASRAPIVLLGAKTKSHILCEKDFKALGCEVKIATDDGSRGHKGFVTDLLQDTIASAIYACGPNPMLKKIAEISKQKNIPAQFSLEEHMACGIGACLGCMVDTVEGNKRVCKEGPVFGAQNVIF